MHFDAHSHPIAPELESGQEVSSYPTREREDQFAVLAGLRSERQQTGVSDVEEHTRRFDLTAPYFLSAGKGRAPDVFKTISDVNTGRRRKTVAGPQPHLNSSRLAKAPPTANP